MSILTDIGTKIGTELKLLDNKIVHSLENSNILQVLSTQADTVIADTAGSSIWKPIISINVTPKSDNSTFFVTASTSASSEQQHNQAALGVTMDSVSYAQAQISETTGYGYAKPIAIGSAINNSSLTDKIVALSYSDLNGDGGDIFIGNRYGSAETTSTSYLQVIEVQK